jgi:hypothetical protein
MVPTSGLVQSIEIMPSETGLCKIVFDKNIVLLDILEHCDKLVLTYKSDLYAFGRNACLQIYGSDLCKLVHVW